MGAASVLVLVGVRRSIASAEKERRLGLARAVPGRVVKERRAGRTKRVKNAKKRIIVFVL